MLALIAHGSVVGKRMMEAWFPSQAGALKQRAAQSHWQAVMKWPLGLLTTEHTMDGTARSVCLGHLCLVSHVTLPCWGVSWSQSDHSSSHCKVFLKVLSKQLARWVICSTSPPTLVQHFTFSTWDASMSFVPRRTVLKWRKTSWIVSMITWQMFW